ncbi:hypothetical protein MIMGU_mgv1a021465mg [Erythranthe guttata]|uniref:FBD domain-containing protein n=1 Tax=Erythranthe guttata TaxID=4155 RepID=A0A022RXX0_ERYGU|nr:hypothetical protein MIMGU_mgv1a021465mg [Erythranthe guttata]
MAIASEQHGGKRLKHSQQTTLSLSIDRLSELPDSVLTHILSFLKTKFSARTSILGQRWRHLWAYVPILDFRQDNQETINSAMLLRKVQTTNFLRLYNSYYYPFEYSDRQLQTWVTFAMARNVKRLDLFLHSINPLPRCLLTCKTLVYMRLVACGVNPSSGNVCLPSLKDLVLYCVYFESDESLQNLLSGCPALEYLTIILNRDMVYCNVSSPKMKRLRLEFVSNGTTCGRCDRLEINAPVLKYLKMVNSFFEHIKCGVLNSLIEADINLVNDNNKPDYLLYSRSLMEFIDRLRNVKRLKLELSYCPKFGEETKGWMEKVPTCVLSHVKIIKLVNIKGKKHELGYIKYLLRNAKVLERMEISYPGSLAWEEKIHLLHEISSFRRASEECEVAFE